VLVPAMNPEYHELFFLAVSISLENKSIPENNNQTTKVEICDCYNEYSRIGLLQPFFLCLYKKNPRYIYLRDIRGNTYLNQ